MSKRKTIKTKTKSKKRERCPNGTNKNKKSGICEPKQKKKKVVVAHEQSKKINKL